MTIPDPSKISFTCSECQAGQLRYKRITYYTWLGNEMITIPDFPAWVCDVCGRREYDQQALNRMNLLLNTQTKRRTPSLKQSSKNNRGGKSISNR